MTEDKVDKRPFDPATRSRGLIASAAWAIVCLLVFVWWASHYQSLVERLGEWQFATFGGYFPSLTVVLVVTLLAAPVALLIAVERRRQLRAAERDGLVTPRDRVTVAVNAALRGVTFFRVVAAVAGLCTLGALLTLLGLPPTTGRPAVVTGREDSVVSAEGPARFAAGRTIGRVARLEENVGLARRVTYVAPVRPIGARTGPVRYFTQVERLAGPQPRFVPLRDGILTVEGAPRELVNLYRAAGETTVDRPALLARSAAHLRWRPIVLAVQLALVALLSFGAAALLRRQARRLQRTLRRDAQA